MYSTCIVWLAFIPIFFGTHHDYQVSINASLSFLLFQHNHHHCESLSFPDQSQMTQKSTANTNITNTNVNIMLLQCWSFVNIILNHHDHHPPSPPGPIVEPVHVRHCQCHRRPLSHVRTEDVTRQYQHHLYSYPHAQWKLAKRWCYKDKECPYGGTSLSNTLKEMQVCF